MIPRAWVPNPARFVPLFRYAGIGQHGRLPPSLPRRWPDKRASDVLDYGLDCREFLAGTRDTIAEYSLAIDPTDVQAPLVVGFGGLLIAWLSGGTPGTNYTANWEIKLRSGQQVVAPIAILVSLAPSLPAPALPTLAVRPSAAASLLARDGTPLLPANGALSSAATTPDGAVLEVQSGGVLLFRA